MEEFSASLVREKIMLADDGPEGAVAKEPVVIRSNRIFLKMENPLGLEKVVVRAQNMHSTLRLAAKVLASFQQDELIFRHDTPFDWEAQWNAVLSGYEKTYNPKIWAATYINGKSAFKTKTAPFVDVIEKCALLTADNYDATMEVTANALKQIGHAMHITHSSNVATVFTDGGDSMRCGIIHRADNKDKTFSFTVTGGKQEERIVQSFGAAAAYLDAFHLQFEIRNLREKLARGQARPVSPEATQARAAVARQHAINKAVRAFEEKYDVHYRPARPDFFAEM